MTALANASNLDAIAEHDRELFGQVCVLSGLSIADRGDLLDDSHPMTVTRDRWGRVVYQCEPNCGKHSIEVKRADEWALHAYAAQSHTPPHLLGDPYELRRHLVADVSGVWLACGSGEDPVRSLRWRGFPPLAFV